ncbi:MAG: hypothetical protein CSA66_03155 [Proteobacteria bacterium]|nr:MAG: hypothetical protein CSA66_03155 [Pseudomonadota bacterium]
MRGAALAGPLSAALVAWAPGPAAAAPDACPTILDACRDAACGARVVRCLLDDPDRAAPEVKEVAKRAAQLWPKARDLRLLLAAAYLADDNAVWALRTLVRWRAAHPDDCEALALIAWTKVRMGLFDDVAPLLEGPACATADAAGTRALLLRALGRHHAGRAAEARGDLARAREQPAAYAEDRGALGALSRIVEPARLRHLAWRVEGIAGWAANPLLGSPNDPQAAAAAEGSGYFDLQAWLRVAPELGAPVRPLLELQPRTVRYLSSAAEGLSTVGLSGRLGAVLDTPGLRVLLAWRPDYLRLDQGDAYEEGPLWYYGGHRAELEVELGPELMVFGGAGVRDFRQLGRSRAEVDLGLGGGVALPARLSLLWAASGRGHLAKDAGYDLVGFNGVTSLNAPLAGPIWARVNLGLGADWYPRSVGRFGDAARRDLTLRAGARLGVTLRSAVRVALAWELTHRDSTIDEYAATDQRVTVRIGWWGDRDLGGPPISAAPAVVPLDWGLEGGAGAEERLQDLLRQDEQVSPSCGCGI